MTKILHSTCIAMLSLQHTKQQSLQILQKLRYRKFTENDLIYTINKNVPNSAI